MKSHPNNTDRKKKFPITITNYHSNICCSVSSLLFPSDGSGPSTFSGRYLKTKQKKWAENKWDSQAIFLLIFHNFQCFCMSHYCKNLQNIGKQFGKNIHEKLSFNLLSSTHCTYPIFRNHIITNYSFLYLST